VRNIYYLCKLDYKEGTFVHTSTFNWDEGKSVFVVAKIIKMCE
jgi:hypothetical protein